MRPSRPLRTIVSERLVGTIVGTVDGYFRPSRADLPQTTGHLAFPTAFPRDYGPL
jgi:hypothetical protein